MGSSLARADKGTKCGAVFSQQQWRPADLAIVREAFPLNAKHGKALESLRCGFHNEVPRLNRLFSCGRSSREGLGILLRLRLDKRSRCTVGSQVFRAAIIPQKLGS